MIHKRVLHYNLNFLCSPCLWKFPCYSCIIDLLWSSYKEYDRLFIPLLWRGFEILLSEGIRCIKIWEYCPYPGESLPVSGWGSEFCLKVEILGLGSIQWLVPNWFPAETATPISGWYIVELNPGLDPNMLAGGWTPPGCKSMVSPCGLPYPTGTAIPFLALIAGTGTGGSSSKARRSCPFSLDNGHLLSLFESDNFADWRASSTLPNPLAFSDSTFTWSLFLQPEDSPFKRFPCMWDEEFCAEWRPGKTFEGGWRDLCSNPSCCCFQLALASMLLWLEMANPGNSEGDSLETVLLHCWGSKHSVSISVAARNPLGFTPRSWEVIFSAGCKVSPLTSSLTSDRFPGPYESYLYQVTTFKFECNKISNKGL